MNTKYKCGKFAATALTLALLCFSASLAYSQNHGNPNPRIIPPHATAHGKTLSEWAVCYWSWILGTPFLEGPMVVDESIYEGQSGSLFFIPYPIRTIDLTIRPGMSLFIPLRVPVWWSPDDDEIARDLAISRGLDPDSLSDEELMRMGANWWADNLSDIYCDIDGMPLDHLERYRFETPAFSFFLNEGWGYASEAKGPAVAAGYALIIPPLPPGEHTIIWGGRLFAGPLRSTVCNLTVR